MFHVHAMAVRQDVQYYAANKQYKFILGALFIVTGVCVYTPMSSLQWKLFQDFLGLVTLRVPLHFSYNHGIDPFFTNGLQWTTM